MKHNYGEEYRRSMPERLCADRWEAQCRSRPKVIIKREESDSIAKDCDASAKAFSIVCCSTKCLFCLGDESLTHYHRVYESTRPPPDDE